ncbi:MAG: response regulator [bacterium]|nr:response regulator [bacterium]
MSLGETKTPENPTRPRPVTAAAADSGLNSDRNVPKERSVGMARVLVIDDSLSAVQKARHVLEKAGYTVETLDLLIYLPQIVKDDPPDAILLDLSMPALSGINVAKFIRRYEKSPIPIILYSSRPVEELIETADQLDAAGYVQKGDPDSHLLSTISHVLSHVAQTGE